jgi:flagellar biosynthetic protein FliQ
VTSAQALELFAKLLQVTIFVAGPVLVTSLLAGLVVGIVQAATQINESSVSFVVKATSVVIVLVAFGPTLVAFAVDYTRGSLLAIEHVVR